MNISATHIKDLFVIDYQEFTDKRGGFVKTIHAGLFGQFGLNYKFKESFFSISDINVIRGMHFQVPPDDHEKLVYVILGEIVDVVLDIRKTSETYGQYFSLKLSSSNRKALYIGRGLAHGFLAMAPGTIVEYHTTTIHSPLSETGIHYSSFGFDWPCITPIVSDRDEEFIRFSNYKSPF